MAKKEHDDYSDDEFDEEYFARSYQPLSNLPTPPPSSRDSLAAQSPRSLLEDGELRQSALLGPAMHLVNLIPTSASLTTPSVALVHEMLTRADLPLDTIALAVCIMDSLDQKFSRHWRLVCPLARTEPLPKRHTMPASPLLGANNQLHIDCVHPEVIILAALMIAFKFLEDCHEPTQYYLSVWGQNRWTCEQVNVTERCVMESLGYRILPLWEPEYISDALRDMELAGNQMSLLPPPRQRPSALVGGTTSTSPPAVGTMANSDDRHRRSMSSGKAEAAVYGLGLPLLPLTPVETPRSEDTPMYNFAAQPAQSAHGPGSDAGASASVATVTSASTSAFAAGCGGVTCETLKLPLDVQRKVFAPADGLAGGIMQL